MLTYRLDRSPRTWTLALSLAAGMFSAACSDDETDGGVGGSSAGSSGASGVGGTGMAGSGSGMAGGGMGGASGGGGSGGGSGSGGNGGSSASGGSASEPDAGADGSVAGPETFSLSSPAFDDNPGCGPSVPERDACDLFPVENTGLGDGTNNVSPQLDWVGAPAGTQSFAIVLHDLVFTPNGDPFTHWAMWNIPASATGLPANLPRDGSPGVPAAATRQVSFLQNDDGFAGSGACGNVYEFVLFALSVPSFEPSSDNPDQVEAAIVASGDVIATATLRARSNPAGPCN